jgi:hypothetical protein
MQTQDGLARRLGFVGILTVAVLVCTLMLQGRPSARNEAFHLHPRVADSARVRITDAFPRREIRLGPGVPVDLPVLPPRVVDWRNDPSTRGLAVGRPMVTMSRLRAPAAARAEGGIAAPGDPCRIDAECDDCNLCTVDDCTDDGVCEGGVRHGFPCDDEEDCQGICVIGLCDTGTPNEGQPCDEDADCGNEPSVAGDCVLGAQEGDHCCSDLDCCGGIGGPHGTCDFRFTCVPLAYQQCVNTPIPNKCDGGDRDQLSCECPGGGTCTGNGNTTCVGGNRAGEACDCPDGGACGPGYERGAECDDGLGCNGGEVCQNNAWISGTPLCDPF